MSSNVYITLVARAVLLIAVQVVVLSRIGAGESWSTYLQPLLYPLAIFLLPVGMPSVIVLCIAFLVGISVDVFLGTPGLHASALVATAFARGLVLTFLEPRDGYSVEQSANKDTFGWRWFLSYAALLFGIHTLVFFSLEVFTFVFFGEILVRALGSFSISMILVLLYVLVFNPKI